MSWEHAKPGRPAHTRKPRRSCDCRRTERAGSPSVSQRSGKENRDDKDLLLKDKSVVLEEYATRLIAAEGVHIREMELMLMKHAPE